MGEQGLSFCGVPSTYIPGKGVLPSETRKNGQAQTAPTSWGRSLSRCGRAQVCTCQCWPLASSIAPVLSPPGGGCHNSQVAALRCPPCHPIWGSPTLAIQPKVSPENFFWVNVPKQSKRPSHTSFTSSETTFFLTGCWEKERREKQEEAEERKEGRGEGREKRKQQRQGKESQVKQSKEKRTRTPARTTE